MSRHVVIIGAGVVGAMLPSVLPWLLRYLVSGAAHECIATTARALRTLLVDAPALRREVAGRAGVAGLVEQKGLPRMTMPA